MTLKEALGELEAFSNETMRAHNIKHGAGNRIQFGVKMGDIRKVANKIKKNQALAWELWDTKIIDARFLATLIIDPKKLSHDDINGMVKSEKFVPVADWLYSNVIKPYPDTEPLRKEWMKSKNIMCARAGWSLTSGCVSRNPGVLDLPALLDRIESEMQDAAPEVQWTMNTTLAQIGINFPQYRARALAIGERLGVYRDYPVSKGCTSPFAPIWINEMVRRKE